MTNKELSQKIRQDLKNAGIAKSAYGISVKYAGYETAVHITIKDLSVSRKKVNNIVSKYKDIDYDACGEILAGGNTYVFVDYDYEILSKAQDGYLEIAKSLIARGNEVCGSTVMQKGNKRLVLFYYANEPQYSKLQIFDDEKVNQDSDEFTWADTIYGIARGLAMFNASGSLN